MAYLRLRYSDGGIPRFAFMCFVQHIINGQLLITKPGIISFPMMSGSTCGVRGIQLYRWYSAVLSVCRNVGYLVGYLTGLFLSLSFGLALTALAVRSLRLSYPPCFFYAGGGGTPALGRAFLRAKHGRRPPSEAVACRLPFSRLFYILFSFFGFFTFSSHLRFWVRHARFFAVFWFFLLAFRGLRHAVVLACFQRF